MNPIQRILKNSKEVLGRNERQLVFIRRNNHRGAVKIADDKVLTKKVLARNNIPIPTQIAVIKNGFELERFNFDSLPESFVVKPVRGTRGGGIEIFYRRLKNGNWVRGDRSKFSVKDLQSHCQDILDGKYSLFNEPDIILFEERVKLHKSFKKYTYKGAPDIRIIVYNHIPIMSYIRIPTEESEGKANLDLGAIGAGVDIAVGKTTGAIIGKSTDIEYVPGTNIRLSGIRIPYWSKILEYAVKASEVTKLGFGAIDFLMDQDKGPVIVELNARPGLSIQLSNNDGMRWRLKKADGLKVKNAEHGVRIGREIFGGEIEGEVESITGKQVIGLIEKVTLIGKNGKEIKVEAKLDTGADSTSIDTTLAEELGFSELTNIPELKKLKIPESLEERQKLEKELTEKLKEKYTDLEEIQFIRSSHGYSIRPYAILNMSIQDFKFETKASIFDRSHLSYKMIIGKNSLRNFLIDPSKA